jgi:hypothetical protein
MSTNNWGEYIIGYKEAGDLLFQHTLEKGRQNVLVFPIIFSYRHYIELILKEIISNNWDYLGINKPFPKDHNIYELWKICRESIQKSDYLIDPQYAQSKEYQKEIVQVYDSLEDDLKIFAEIDPDSQRFRYPVNNKGNPLGIDNKQLIALYQNLPALVTRISYYLNGISTGIYTILQDKYKFLSESG